MPVLPARRSIRLPAYDYATPGAYFITICVQARRCLFGEIASGAVEMSPAGRMVADLWDRLPTKFSSATVDASVLMPNHIHGIIILHERPGAAPLSQIVGWFKTMTTNAYIRGVRADGWPRFDGRLWQRNYYERVLRDEDRLTRARRYIAENPARWADDPERPTSPSLIRTNPNPG